MLKCEVIVVNRLGLHARAAGRLKKTAESFKSRIRIGNIEGTVYADAKSILSILSLAASRGKRLMVTAEGPDEQYALEAISALFQNGFDEK